MGVLEQYKTRPVEQKPELANVSLLEFATSWNWKGNHYTKRGSRGAKPFAVNVYDICLNKMNQRFMKSIVMLG
jgi:hypothetical protein